jgi:LPS sulfotransferase NodH
VTVARDAATEAVKDAAFLADLVDRPVWPVFILGLHRSGTTLLYSLLARAGGFNPVTAYHLACYDELLHNHAHGRQEAAREALTGRLAADGQSDRGIDRVAATADTPEEYAFLLLEKTGARQVTPAGLPWLVELAHKVAHLADNDRAVLLKNPYDLGTFTLLRDAFPGARFVFIHRHPLAALTSSVRALRALLATRNAYTAELSAPYRALHDQPLALATARALFHARNPLGPALLALGAGGQVRYYLRHVTRLPPERVTELRYEDLCADPEGTVGKVLAQLGQPDLVPGSVADAVAPRAVPVDPGVARLAGLLHRLWRPYYDRFGYHREPG